MRKVEIALAFAIVAMLGAATRADDCCSSCGCNCNVHAVCRLKCETKKVPKVTYSCECEDFCIPGVSKKCGTVTETDQCGCEHCKPNWVPTCASVHTRKKLIKHVTMKEEKSYKWVVEYVCDRCAKCTQCTADAAAPGPAPQNATTAVAPQSAVYGDEAFRQPPAPAIDR